MYCHGGSKIHVRVEGKQEDDVNVSHLTRRESKHNGVFGCKGASFHLDNVSVENSGGIGVAVYGTKRNSMKNCNVSHSKCSGLYVDGGGGRLDKARALPTTVDKIANIRRKSQTSRIP